MAIGTGGDGSSSAIKAGETFISLGVRNNLRAGLSVARDEFRQFGADVANRMEAIGGAFGKFTKIAGAVGIGLLAWKPALDAVTAVVKDVTGLGDQLERADKLAQQTADSITKLRQRQIDKSAEEGPDSLRRTIDTLGKDLATADTELGKRRKWFAENEATGFNLFGVVDWKDIDTVFGDDPRKFVEDAVKAREKLAEQLTEAQKKLTTGLQDEVDRQTKALKEQADTFGMAADEIARYRLVARGATADQLRGFDQQSARVRANDAAKLAAEQAVKDAKAAEDAKHARMRDAEEAAAESARAIDEQFSIRQRFGEQRAELMNQLRSAGITVGGGLGSARGRFDYGTGPNETPDILKRIEKLERDQLEALKNIQPAVWQ